MGPQEVWGPPVAFWGSGGQPTRGRLLSCFSGSWVGGQGCLSDSVPLCVPSSSRFVTWLFPWAENIWARLSGHFWGSGGTGRVAQLFSRSSTAHAAQGTLPEFFLGPWEDGCGLLAASQDPRWVASEDGCVERARLALSLGQVSTAVAQQLAILGSPGFSGSNCITCLWSSGHCGEPLLAPFLLSQVPL